MPLLLFSGGRSYADNIFVERLWRTVKYEEVYLKAYAGAGKARRELGAYFRFYNDQRPHQALGYRTPGEVFSDGADFDYCVSLGVQAGCLKVQRYENRRCVVLCHAAASPSHSCHYTTAAG